MTGEEAESAIACLENPDANSSDPDNEGRRIERVPGGWLVLNAEKHRAMVTRAVIQEQTRLRVQRHREGLKRKRNARVTRSQKANASVTPSETGSETGSESTVAAPKEPDPRVREFIDWFHDEYAKERNGAKYIVKGPKDGATVKRLLGEHSLDRLKKHAFILLTTNEPWIENTDRGIGILSAKINWLEDRLADWERRNRSAARES